MVAKHDELIWQDIINLTGALLSSQVVFILLGTQVCLQSPPLGRGCAAATAQTWLAHANQLLDSRQPHSLGDTMIHTYAHVHMNIYS